MNYVSPALLASTYGSGGYDSCTYDGNASCSSSSTSGTSSLVNTGFPVLPVIGLAILVILAAVFVSIKQRRTRKRNEAANAKQSQPTGNTYGAGGF